MAPAEITWGEVGPHLTQRLCIWEVLDDSENDLYTGLPFVWEADMEAQAKGETEAERDKTTAAE